MTEYLMLLLRRSGYNFHTSAEFQIVKNIKEKLCNPWLFPLKEADYKSTEDKNNIEYYLPDGSEIKLKTEHIEAPEILFTPQKIGLEYVGLHEMVVNSIMKCDIDLRNTIFSNLIVAGGTTAMKRFSERLHKSVAKLAPKDVKIKLIAPKNRDISCWIGGSTLSALKAFNEMWITKQEYSEHGANIFRQYM